MRGDKTITIFLADDHPLVRQGMRSVLESEQNYSIVGEASDGLTAFDQINRLRPKVAIIDVVMPGITGLEVARKIKENNLSTRVIIVSTFVEDSYVMEALRAGVMGYLSKETPPAALIDAINEVEQGRHYLCTTLMDRAINQYFDSANKEPIDAYESLTSREREVLYLACEGLSNKEIGDRLVISPRTVEVHRGNFMEKLGLKNQIDLLRFAIKRKIIHL